MSFVFSRTVSEDYPPESTPVEGLDLTTVNFLEVVVVGARERFVWSGSE